MENGLVSSQEMEHYHGIVPNTGQSRRHNPDVFNPMKIVLVS